MRTSQKKSTLFVGLALSLAGLYAVSVFASLRVYAQETLIPAAPSAEWRVCPSGCPFSSVQAAVDAANSGDIIKIAAGVYTDVHVRPRLDPELVGAADITAGVVTQVVYLTKTVVLRGGYEPTFAEPPDPAVHPTVLDANQLGRGIYIGGAISPTVEGLRITGGSGDEGGGIFAYLARPTVRSCEIISNRARQGGGVYLSSSAATLHANAIRSNTATEGGGGLYMIFSPAALDRNQILGNHSGNRGGGVQMLLSEARFTNTVVADNDAVGNGSGVYITAGAPVHLVHTTLARNHGAGGQGLYLLSGAAYLTNTIVASHTVGVNAASGTQVQMTATLWGSGAWANGNNTKGLGSIDLGAINIDGDPAFVAPASGDYHIGPLSAAIDQGVATNATHDLDGEVRPHGAAPDLGADEAGSSLVLDETLYLPAVLAP